jgi:hypothetical protein
MAFTLGSFAADTTLTHIDVLLFVADSTLVRTPKLPTFTADSTLTPASELAEFIVDSTLTPASELAEFIVDSTLSRSPPLPNYYAAATLPKISAFLAGPRVVRANLKAMTASLSGPNTQLGKVSARLHPLAASLRGPAGDAVKAVAKPMQASLSGPNTQLGKVSARLHPLAASLAGKVTTLGTISAKIPALTARVSALVGVKGSVTAAVPILRAAVRGGVGTRGTIGATLPLVRMRVGGYAAVLGIVAARLKPLQIRMNGSIVVTQKFTMVTNLITKAVTFYQNYPYNSFAQIGANYYAAGPNGLTQIEISGGDVTSGVTTPVDALWRFGQLDFGIEQQKRMSESYVAMRADGDMKLRLYTDEQEPVEYTIQPHNIATLKQRRALIGKGARGKYWQLEMGNTAGCDFDVDTISVTPTVTSRRI